MTAIADTRDNIFLNLLKIGVLCLLVIAKLRLLVAGFGWRLYVGMRLFFPNIFAIYVSGMLYQKL